MTSDPWYAEMARRHHEHDAEPERAPPSGPTPDGCAECWEWKPDMKSGEVDGWWWFKICPMDCPHKHHEGEVWLAAQVPLEVSRCRT